MLSTTTIAGLWALTALVAAIGKVIIVWLALRDTKPDARPKIIAALADLFRWWRLK
jgi:hypothetical protein